MYMYIKQLSLNYIHKACYPALKGDDHFSREMLYAEAVNWSHAQKHPYCFMHKTGGLIYSIMLLLGNWIASIQTSLSHFWLLPSKLPSGFFSFNAHQGYINVGQLSVFADTQIPTVCGLDFDCDLGHLVSIYHCINSWIMQIT